MGAFSGLASAAGSIVSKAKSRFGAKPKAKSSPASSSDSSDAPEMATYHKGGKVRKTGPARLKKGEVVLTKGQQKKLKKRMRGK